MSSVDPYASPNAMGKNSTAEFYEPQVFSFEGRIGRLRYLAYGLLYNVLLYAVLGIAMAISAVLGDEGLVALIAGLLSFVVAIVGLVVVFGLAVRRINDFNATGWWSILLIVPLVNVIFSLVLLFMPGTKGDNNYGPQPITNTLPVILGALAMPIFIIGVLAAVAIPAYQDYVERAQAFESMQSD